MPTACHLVPFSLDPTSQRLLVESSSENATGTFSKTINEIVQLTRFQTALLIAPFRDNQKVISSQVWVLCQHSVVICKWAHFRNLHFVGFTKFVHMITEFFEFTTKECVSDHRWWSRTSKRLWSNNFTRLVSILSRSLCVLRSTRWSFFFFFFFFFFATVDADLYNWSRSHFHAPGCRDTRSHHLCCYRLYWIGRNGCQRCIHPRLGLRKDKSSVIPLKKKKALFIQLGAVKLVLWRHWMHLNYMHPVTSENQFHCTKLYNGPMLTKMIRISAMNFPGELFFQHQLLRGGGGDLD